MTLPSILKSWVRPLVAWVAKPYLESYAGLEDVFYRRNHIVAFDLEDVRMNVRSPWNPPPEVGEYIKNGLLSRPPLYDGLSLKLWSFAFDRGTGVLNLEVSYGCYSQYFFTNLDDEFRRKFSNSRYWFNALNIGALLITADNKLRLHKRSPDARQSPGKLDTPCGHPTGMKEVPAKELIPAALEAILKKELGFAVTITSTLPLVAFIAHPNLDFNLMYLVKVAETGKELEARKMALSGEKHKEVYFIDAATENLTSFLKSRRRELSRSLPEAILHLIRRERLKIRHSQNSKMA